MTITLPTVSQLTSINAILFYIVFILMGEGSVHKHVGKYIGNHGSVVESMVHAVLLLFVFLLVARMYRSSFNTSNTSTDFAF